MAKKKPLFGDPIQNSIDSAQTSNAPTSNNIKANGTYQQGKGFVTDTGQTYPTNNPNFRPSANPEHTIKFNADGTVDVGVHGTKQNLNQSQYQEYNNTIKGMGRSFDPKVQSLDTEAQAAQAQAANTMQAVSGIGLTPQEIAQAQAQATEAPINIGQALTAGFANVAPSTIGGAAGGAAVGAVAGGLGAAPGAIIGGIGGFVTGLFNGIRTNIKSQQGGEIASTKKILTAAKTNMRQLATLAGKDPANAAQYRDSYNQQLANVYRAQAKLKLETQGNLNAFMEDGTADLAEFDLFLQNGGMANIYKQRLEMALLRGASMDFTTEDLAMASEE